MGAGIPNTGTGEPPDGHAEPSPAPSAARLKPSLSKCVPTSQGLTPQHPSPAGAAGRCYTVWCWLEGNLSVVLSAGAEHCPPVQDEGGDGRSLSCCTQPPQSCHSHPRVTHNRTTRSVLKAIAAAGMDGGKETTTLEGGSGRAALPVTSTTRAVSEGILMVMKTPWVAAKPNATHLGHQAFPCSCIRRCLLWGRILRLLEGAG